MAKRVSINQPAYLPWLGYFDRIARSDLHIVLDNVQFEKNSFVNRNKVRTAQGWTWLTVPVRTSDRFGDLSIDRLEIANDGWRRKHWETIRQSYARAPFFETHRTWLEPIYHQSWDRLAPLMEAITRGALDALGITTPLLYGSSLGVTSTKSDLVLDLCRKVGATEYISGPLGRNYLDIESFLRAGIKVSFHDYSHPVYEQAFPGFEPAMAVIDLLMNRGKDSLGTLTYV